MKYIVVFFLLINTLFGSLFAQTKLSQTDFNLGNVELLNADVVDISINNSTSEDIYILRVDAEKEVSVKYTSKTIAPNKQETLRLKLNPNKTGRIKRQVKIYLNTNREPIELNITANIKAIPKNNRQACPSFGSALKAPTGQQKFVAQIKSYAVSLYDENDEQELIAEKIGTKDEKQTLSTPIPPKVPSTPRTSVNQRPPRPKKVRKTPEERRNSPSLLEILFGNKEAQEKNEHVKDTIPEKPVKSKVEEAKKEEIQIVEKDDNLLDDSYKANNIIFLIDASTSMREDEKMEILKKAMVELLIPLRAIDYLSIVTYSGDAEVILAPTSAVKKEEIEQTINNISADGSTQAVKGIKKAIQVGKSNFIEDGNNQIILATDGAFDIGVRNASLRKKIKNTANDGIGITVLAIKNAKWTNKSLKEIVELGNGNLIKLDSKNDASKVLEEIKEKSVY